METNEFYVWIFKKRFSSAEFDGAQWPHVPQSNPPSRNVIFGSDGYGCKVLIIEIRLGHIVLFFCVGGGGMEILSITA